MIHFMTSLCVATVVVVVLPEVVLVGFLAQFSIVTFSGIYFPRNPALRVRFRFPTFSHQPNMEKYVACIFVGLDFLGCAVDGLGNSVSLFVDSSVHPGQISISHIFGNPCSKLSRNPLWNCVGIAAIEVMKMLGIRSVSLSLSLHKGLPLGFGLGSNAASAAAVATNEIFGGKLGSEELVLAGLKLEEKVSGYHVDNVGPAENLRLYSMFGWWETVGK